MVEFFRISYEEHFPHSSSNISVVDSGQDPLHSDVERERERETPPNVSWYSKL